MKRVDACQLLHFVTIYDSLCDYNIFHANAMARDSFDV